jgi:hypothetical protein
MLEQRADEETTAFMAFVLDRGTKRIRERASRWLVQHGEAAVAAVTSLLQARSAKVHEQARLVLEQLRAAETSIMTRNENQ